MDVIGWLLEGDPAIRWQVLRDLTEATPVECVAANTPGVTWPTVLETESVHDGHIRSSTALDRTRRNQP
jgi:hypothetical protein